MALRLRVSSTGNALKISVASNSHLSASRCFSSVLDGLRYANSHECVKHDGSVAIVGITDHAQGYLGEVVFVELPDVGVAVSRGKSFGAVESVKATSDVKYSPIFGEVVEVNTALSEAPGAVNTSLHEEGWMIKVKPSNPSELDSLLGPIEYTKFWRKKMLTRMCDCANLF